MKMVFGSAVLVSLLCAQAALASGFTVGSPQLRDGGSIGTEQVFNSFGCTGGNVSPALGWRGAPTGTRSFAITVYDPDAPTGSVQSRTDYGKPGYGGPCPPPGDKAHRYRFTVYALKTDKLPLDENAPAAMVGYYLHQNTLATAELRATFGR